MFFLCLEHKIVIVGLDNAGKTTILYQLLMNEVVHTSPTIGSNVEEVVWNNLHFIMWDLGGQEVLRAAWNTYYTNTEVWLDKVILIVVIFGWFIYTFFISVAVVGYICHIIMQYSWTFSINEGEVFMWNWLLPSNLCIHFYTFIISAHTYSYLINKITTLPLKQLQWGTSNHGSLQELCCISFTSLMAEWYEWRPTRGSICLVLTNPAVIWLRADRGVGRVSIGYHALGGIQIIPVFGNLCGFLLPHTIPPMIYSYLKPRRGRMT